MTNINPPITLYEPDSILYDPASPNSYDPFDCPTAPPDPPPPSKSANPKFLDMDDPGPSANFTQQPLPYDDPPTSGPLRKTLASISQTAAIRAQEAEGLFGGIANLLDNHCRTLSSARPSTQTLALQRFSNEVIQVATKHFEEYVRGLPNCPTTEQYSSNMSPHIEKTKKASNPPSYAKILKSVKPTIPFANPCSTQAQTQPSLPRERPDDRLFLRLPENSSLRTHSGYALQSLIKSKLGANAPLLTSVLPTRSGFALCPSSGNSTALEEKLKSANIFGDIPVEKASPWSSYRISNVPRTYGAINDNLQHCLLPVTADALATAITTEAGTSPTSVTPSRENDADPSSCSTSWIVRFPAAHNRLTRSIYLFGCKTTVRLLPRRVTTTQCTRCWLWHNTRICASTPRCRLCGSAQHEEKNHANHCAAPVGHVCPPRCIHCHGPHPADYDKCELRPSPTRMPKTKAQITTIRQIFTKARLRSQAEAGCCKPPKDITAQPNGRTSPSNICQNSSPPSSKPASPNSASDKISLPNTFELLNNEKVQSDLQMSV